MAFTCLECAVKEVKGKQAKQNVKDNFGWRPTSYGPCESCSKSAVCLVNG